MTYLDLIRDADRKLDTGDITLGEYEKIIAPLKQEIQPEIIRCKDCSYYDAPHIENDGVRYEYTDMPEEAFDELGTGLVTAAYGINVGGRCCRDYKIGYSGDKRIFVPENNYCGRAERRNNDL